MKKIVGKNDVNLDENVSNKNKIKDDKSFQILKLALDEIKEKYNLSSSEILSFVEEKHVSKEILIPVSVFENDLSALEAVCKYLKEELEFSYNKIALLLNRNHRTIWTTYNNAVVKIKEKLVVKESRYFVPVFVIAERRFSVLESIVSYLRERYKLRYSEIAVLLNRDERNVWSVYKRSLKKKNENKK